MIKYSKNLITVIIMLFCLSKVIYVENNEIASEKQDTVEIATFGGGCFWGVEDTFQKQKGVIEVISGYSGGTGENPTYEDYGKKGHTEVVQVKYDPSKIDYLELLDIFWGKIGASCQYSGMGVEYKSVIYYHNDKQKKLAQESKVKLSRSGKYEDPVVTEIIKASEFYKAEEYHQDYYNKSIYKIHNKTK